MEAVEAPCVVPANCLTLSFVSVCLIECRSYIEWHVVFLFEFSTGVAVCLVLLVSLLYAWAVSVVVPCRSIQWHCIQLSRPF